jgi:uncharacterized FlaG/YvyC family protein
MNISSTHASAAPVTSAAEPSTSRALPQDQSALLRAVQSLNESEMFGQDNELTFAIDRAARVVVVRVVNKDTGDLVEQIPSGVVLRLAEELNTEHAKQNL